MDAASTRASKASEDSSASGSEPRSLKMTEIRPPSLRDETLNVLKAAFAVVVIVAAYVFRPSFDDQSPNLQSRQSPTGLLPYQTLVRDASPAEQRIFRELQEGLLEAERIRANSGQWPDVATLAAEGIPPFASDPSKRGPSYKWTSVRQDWVVNYLGVPSDAVAPSWVLVILEPEPDAPADPAPNDETHHRLPDGTTLHVSIWNIREEKRKSGFAALRLPQNDGWTQLMVGQQ
jgi:hypothetical protein